MTGRRRGPAPDHARRRRWTVVGLAAAALGVTFVVGVSWLVLDQSDRAGKAPWTRFGTEDVHSLTFVDDDPRRLLFGHHGGLLETIDGGRTWRPLATRSDAMSMGAASGGSIVIAGHDVFTASRDGGATWQDVASDLPSLDIHGFARDPGDPARMWAYPTSGGLWESRDGGSHWERVYGDSIMLPIATVQGGQTVLHGVDVAGLASSADGGRTWTPLTTPPAYPFTTFTATPDGSVMLVGSPDGIYRSDDGAQSWTKLPFDGGAFAIAVTSGGQDVAVVNNETELFRSSDGGQTWPGPGAP